MKKLMIIVTFFAALLMSTQDLTCQSRSLLKKTQQEAANKAANRRVEFLKI